MLHVKAPRRPKENLGAATANLVADLDGARMDSETYPRAAVDLVTNRYAAAGPKVNDAMVPREATSVNLVEQGDGASGTSINVTVPVDLSLSTVVAGFADANVARRRQRHAAVVIDFSTDGDRSKITDQAHHAVVIDLVPYGDIATGVSANRAVSVNLLLPIIVARRADPDDLRGREVGGAAPVHLSIDDD